MVYSLQKVGVSLDIIFSTTGAWNHFTSAVGEFVLNILTFVVEALYSLCKFEETADLTFANSILLNSDSGILNPSIGDKIFNGDITRIFQPAAVLLIMGFTIIALFKNLISDRKAYVSPMVIIGKSTFYTILVAYYHIWLNGLFGVVFHPIAASIETIAITDVKSMILTKFSMNGTGLTDSDYMSSLKTTDFDFLSLSFLRSGLLLFVLIPLLIQFCCLFLEVMERFIHVFFIILFGPLFLSCGANTSTERIASTWLETFINTTALLVINLLLVKLCLTAFVNFVTYMALPDGYGTLKDTVIPFITLYVLIRVSYRFDNLFESIGFTTVTASNIFEQIDRQMHKIFS